MHILKDYRSQAKGLADLLPYAALVDKGVVLNKDGSFTAGWLCSGKDTASSTPEEMALQSAQFNHAAKLLETGWMLHMDAFRTPHDAYSRREDSHFSNDIAQLLDDERRTKFSDGRCYTTTTALTLTYKPDFQLTKLSRATQTGVDTSSGLEKNLIQFTGVIQEMEELLSSVLQMDRLTEYYEENLVAERFLQSDLLSHLQQCISGVLQPISVPPIPMYLDAILGGEDLIGGLLPKFGNKHIAVLAIDGLPSSSQPAMLHTLDTLPVGFRWNTRAIFLSQYDATKKIEEYWKTWNQQVFKFMDKFFNNPNARPNRDALVMREDAEEAKMEVQNGVVGAAFISSNIVLMDEDKELLEENARELRKVIRTLGFGCRIESINALEAWLGTLPGNSTANIRRPMVNTLNLAHVTPLSSVWTGKKYNPCPFYPPQSPPLSVVLTEGNTPFWFNLHSGDLAHTLILGPTGSGKSTLLGHIAAQFMRYDNSQIFAFDKGLSMFPLNLASKGTHYDIGQSETLAFAPLSDIDNEEGMAWATEWIADLMELQGVKVLPSYRNDIHDGLTRLCGNPKEMRGLTEFWNLVPNVEVKETIKHYTTQGAMGHLLDSKYDTLGFSSFTVFEIEQLMNMGDKNLIPVLTYIFRRIEQSLNGNPTLLFLDEAWVVLGHPVFRAKIREWLKVLRKKNCGVVLATQSLSDARDSGILDVLVESCLTKILLANSAARQEDQKTLYRDIGCNQRMIDIIATSTPKRDYYLLQPEGRRVIQLGLGPKELAFIGASDPESIQKIKELHATFGADAWQQKWLEARHAA